MCCWAIIIKTNAVLAEHPPPSAKLFKIKPLLAPYKAPAENDPEHINAMDTEFDATVDFHEKRTGTS